jgi:hypothetical protein
LVVGVENRAIENDWKFAVFPAAVDLTPRDVKITKDFKEAMRLLKCGERVLYLPPPNMFDFNCPPQSDLPHFSNAHKGPNWTRTLGFWFDETHPALNGFPTTYGMEWHWSGIVNKTRGMNLEGLPNEVQPFIQPIDYWSRNYKLALAFECKVYGGKLVICSADLETDLDARPAARQLLYSILNYMNSDTFAPDIEVTEKQLNTFIYDNPMMKKLGVTVKYADGTRCDSLENIIDGDGETYWLAGRNNDGTYPFEIDFDVPQPVTVKGLTILPRQNNRDHEGAVKSYEVSASLDGLSWNAVARGELSASFDVKRIDFAQPETLKTLRLKLIEGFSADKVLSWYRERVIVCTTPIIQPFQDPCASLAEVAFIL